MSNFIQAAISQIKSGSTDNGAGVDIPEPESQTVDASDSIVETEIDTGIVAGTKSEEESESTQEDSTEGSDETTAAQPKAQAKPQTPDQEVITISDDKGRRKVTIDYTDRASIKKAFEMMHGARKWQAERDRATLEAKELNEKHSKVRTVMDALEKAYQEKGELGVIDLIAGKPGASQEFLRRQIDRAKFLERASPEEKDQLAQKERLEQLEKDHARLREEGTQREERIRADREQAELHSLESTVHPSFEKYRFEGKLGSAEDEDMFDEMLWNTALKRLKPYEEKGVKITRELVDTEFRTVASALRKRVGAQAEKKAGQVVEQRKREATENAQASTMNAYSKGGAAAEAQDMIQRGDFFSLFKKHGASMGKKR